MPRFGSMLRVGQWLSRDAWSVGFTPWAPYLMCGVAHRRRPECWSGRRRFASATHPPV